MEIQVEPNSQHVMWIIKDFLELPQKDDSYLESPEFLFSGDRYCLRVYPNVNRSNERKTAFHVRRLGVSDPEREVSYKIGFMYRGSTGDDWYEHTPMGLEQNIGHQRSLIEEKRDVIVPDGNFTIICSMHLSKNSRVGSSAQEDEDQGRFPGHNVLFSSRWSSSKMELLLKFPCTHVQLTVPKFLDLPRETWDSLTSPEFRFAGDTYYFRFRANGDTTDTDLELVRLTSNFIENTVSYRIGFCVDDDDFYMNNSRSLVGSTGLCITLSKLLEKRGWYVSDGTLRLVIFLRLEEQSSAGAGTFDAVHEGTGLSDIEKLQSDRTRLLQEETESEVCFLVRGKEFRVHRNVLRARSKVFEAMFGHDTDEKESGRVVVDDLDPETFGDFIEYLCNGDIEAGLSDDNAFGLYVAANRYAVSTLKAKCLEHIRRSLSVDSLCDVLERQYRD